jgi:hypothetical protein
MKTLLTLSTLLLAIIAFSQEKPKKLEGLAYIPTLYVDIQNPTALEPLRLKIKALLPTGAEVMMRPLADSTLLDIRTWQLNENKKWEERVREISQVK